MCQALYWVFCHEFLHPPWKPALLLYSFYRWEHWSPERIKTFPKIRFCWEPREMCLADRSPCSQPRHPNTHRPWVELSEMHPDISMRSWEMRQRLRPWLAWPIFDLPLAHTWPWALVSPLALSVSLMPNHLLSASNSTLPVQVVSMDRESSFH